MAVSSSRTTSRTIHMIKIILAFGLTVVMSGVSRGQSQAARDSAEASVLRWLSGGNAPRDSAAVIIRATYSREPICGWASTALGCGSDIRTTPPVSTSRVVPALRAAIANHDSLTPISSEIPARVLELTGRRVVDSSSQADDGSCRGSGRFQATRVGLDSALTYAVLSYEISFGHGPYPSCGWASGRTVYLRRRADGSWETVEVTAYWIT